ncbi:unnamed protein product [Somion occarium]|uniref:Carbohydrate-binding module family 19 domain-containing protein n=1 Tax=Somion occarium TaxID=3059160 RepID=A0ABP1E802_9APHY
MVQLAAKSSLLLAFIAVAQGAPLYKRIAQTIAESTAQWEKACLAAGGGEKCNPVSVTAFSTLLAAAGPCEQQDSADAMIDLAKTLNNDPDMIKLAQIFAQQPRNTPTSQSVPYCQQAPNNSELNGLFQCQFQGADPKTFAGGIAAGQTGTIPFGQNAPLDPAGSCPANPQGPIPDGQQLVSITQDPGVGSTGSGNGNGNGSGNGNNNGNGNGDGQSDSGVSSSAASTAAASATSSAVASATSDASGSSDDTDTDPANATATSDATLSAPAVTATATGNVGGNDESSAAAPAATATAAPTGAATTAAAPAASTSAASGNAGNTGSGDFLLQNGQDAQALNAKFATLSTDGTCTDGDSACVEGGFAQCVGGKFVINPCAGGLQCFALPLVNKAGTSLTCDTQADAEARIAASGAQGGLTGAN